MDRADLVFDSHVKQRVKAVAIGVSTSQLTLLITPIYGEIESVELRKS
jgi:hypothetical protein